MVDPHSFYQRNLTMNNDLNESTVSMERLKTQFPAKLNFTSMLNNPTEHSYLNGFKKKFFSGMYDTQPALEFDLSRDYDKFNDFASVTSEASTKSSKTSFKELLNESLDDYIMRIRAKYQIYRQNHNVRRVANTTHSKESKVLSETKVQIYQPSQKFYKTFPKEFLTEDYKMSAVILEKRINEIEAYCRNLIEKVGDTEMEIQRILNHSNKLYNYINNNLLPLNTELKTLMDKVEEMKFIKGQIQTKYMKLTARTILNGEKRRNITNLIGIFKDMKVLSEIFELLKVLSTNQGKFQVTIELIAKAKGIIFKLNSLKQSRSQGNITKMFEEELRRHSNKMVETLFQELHASLLNSFGKMITIHSQGISLNCEEFDADVIKYLNKDGILHCVSMSEFETERLSELISFVIQTDCDYFTKLKNVLTKTSYHVFVSKLDEIQNFTTTNFNSDKHDLSILLISIKIAQTFLNECGKFNSVMLEQIQRDITINQKQEDIVLLRNCQEEIKEIESTIKSEFYNVINSLLIKSLKRSLITRKILPNEYITTCIKYEERYILQYFEKRYVKIKESLECEDWNAFSSIPENFQRLADIISTFDISHIRQMSKEQIIQHFEELCTSEQTKTTIEINKINFKLMSTTLEVLKVTCDSLKMLSIFTDSGHCMNIIKQLVSIFKTFVQLNKEMILDGKYNNGQSLSQNEISITCANISIIKNIVLALSHNDTSGLLLKYSNMCSSTLFIDLIQMLENLIQSCKCKITEMIDNQCLSLTLNELHQIKLPFYPIVDPDSNVPVNAYAFMFSKFFKAIYNSMLNAFDNTYIVNTCNESLKKFFNALEKFLLSGPKIENEVALKQYKKDMLFLKKHFIFTMELADHKLWKERIDALNKKILPVSLRRQATNNKIQDEDK